MTIALNKKIKLPNFLIVGAARSGTSSVYEYLKQHPEVYMPPLKEPKFMTSQFLKFPFNGPGDDKYVDKIIIKSFTEYEKLFEYVTNEKAIGEASADNLYFYKEAIKYIKKYLGDVKIIIILRNPADRAFSTYLMMRRQKREELPFEKALEVEKERQSVNWEFIWRYADVGFYYKQVRAYLDNFKDVKVYLYEELEKDAMGLIKDIYRYLGIDPSFTPDTSIRYGFSNIARVKHLKILTEENALKSTIERVLGKLPLGAKSGLYRMHYRIKNKIIRPQMKKNTRKYLNNLYKDDIQKLQTLIKKDLSFWLS